MNANEILCKGLEEGGVERVFNFPGFESHKIFEALGGKTISCNEKIAYESAFGASLAGKRSVVTMKNVGLDIAADSFLHSMLSGVNGGLVLIVTDDTQVTCSQERLDSRHYRDFYRGLWFEPNSLENLYYIAKRSFKLSEELDIPIVIRLTNQILSKAGNISTPKSKGRAKNNKKLARGNPQKYIVHPVYWQDQYNRLKLKNKKCDLFVKKYYFSELVKRYKRKRGIIVFGDCTKELVVFDKKDFDILHITTYPYPCKLVTSFIKGKNEVLVLEQGDSYGLKSIQILLGKQLHDDIKVSGNTGDVPDMTGKWRIWQDLSMFFKALKEVRPSFVVSDVTQFTVESETAVDACLCMGASISTGIGLCESGVYYPFCIVGDISFLHGGFLALKEAVARNLSMCVVIVDNGGSWCTGGQKAAFSIYNLFGNEILQTKISYSDTTKEKLVEILDQMKKNNRLSILYLKI